jgi:hypothetical protein
VANRIDDIITEDYWEKDKSIAPELNGLYECLIHDEIYYFMLECFYKYPRNIEVQDDPDIICKEMWERITTEAKHWKLYKSIGKKNVYKRIEE